MGLSETGCIALLNRHHVGKYENPSGLSLTLHSSMFIHPHNGLYQNVREECFLYYEYPRYRDPQSLYFMEYNHQWVHRYCDTNFRKLITILSYSSSETKRYNVETGRIVNRAYRVGDKMYMCLRLF